ncbi:MAG: S1C family serine protease [Fimbriiglobus sp.]|jgi:serine protease Do|nr:S1C family serine protease [Fimbriiglobus sp.]
MRTLLLLLLLAAPAVAADPFGKVAAQVNEKCVKIFGAGGFRGATNYSTGVLVSADGHFVTIASQTLDTSELIVHLHDGRRMKAVVLATEPELDIALCYIRLEGKRDILKEPNGLDLAHFDIAEAAKRKPAEAGDWVLAHSNLFEIAMRDEPLSVMQGSITGVSKLHGKRGIFDFPYTGDVYVVDAITNGPGAGGGPLTTRKGELLGLIGREIKNGQSETWINYAIPVFAEVEIKEDKDKLTKVSIPQFVELAKQGKYKTRPKLELGKGPGGYTGIKFVPNVLDRTPPYVDEVTPGSPAAKAGIQVNDLVSFIDGEPIYSIKTYLAVMSRTQPGGTVRMEVRRGDNLQSVEIVLGEWPKGTLKPAAAKPDEKK